jgi:hypothetical protein
VLHDLLREPNLYDLLLRIDEELCEEQRRAGCPKCGAPLHAAHYERKPRGAPVELPPNYDRRLSLCCAREGCRKRATPPSVRFLGRRVYLAAVIVVVAVIQQGPTRQRLARLHELLGVSRWTVARWRRWWLDGFPRTSLWRIQRARVMPPVDEQQLPASLLERFLATAPGERLAAFLRFLSPLTVPGS